MNEIYTTPYIHTSENDDVQINDALKAYVSLVYRIATRLEHETDHEVNFDSMPDSGVP